MALCEMGFCDTYEPKDELMTALSSIFRTGRFSDFTIICQSRRFKVHKALLCSRSTFFDGAFAHSFLESSTNEIDLSDEDEEVVAQMVQYFYQLDYMVHDEACDQLDRPSIPRYTEPNFQRPRLSKLQTSDLVMIEDPLVATASANSPPSLTFSPAMSQRSSFDDTSREEEAESPTIDGKSVCVRRVSNGNGARDGRRGSSPVVHVRWSSSNTEPVGEAAHLVIHAKMYAVAEKYGINGLKTLAQLKFETLVAKHWNTYDFLDSIAEIYTSTVDTDRGLRNVVIHIFRSHPELAHNAEAQTVVKSVPDFTFDLFKMHYNISNHG